MAPLPIKFTEVLQLSSVGVDAAAIGFNSCVSCFAYIMINLRDNIPDSPL